MLERHRDFASDQRERLEARCAEIGYTPEETDTDQDLEMILAVWNKGE